MIVAILLGLLYAILVTALVELLIRNYSAIDLGIVVARVATCLLAAGFFGLGTVFGFPLGLKWRLLLAGAFFCFLYTVSHLTSETLIKGWERYRAQRSQP